MDALETIRGRRSIRAFEQRVVPRDIVEHIIFDAACAPPPFSGQTPWTFHVFEGAERIAQYGARAKQYAREERPGDPAFSWTEREEFQVFWGAPALIVISGRIEDCCRAGQNLMLSAHARGLGTCWVGAPMLWLQSAPTRAELGLPVDPMSAICLGYPAAIPAPPARGAPKIVWA